jgi:serine/threonine-protein kinase
MGTPFYMSPEQAQGRKDIDHRSDIYSLGVILFQALTGQYPFDDEAYPMLVLKICTEPAPSAALFRKDLPAALVHVIDKCLQKSPADRFQSCEELKRALAPFRAVIDAPDMDASAPSTSTFTASAIVARPAAQTDLSGGDGGMHIGNAATVLPTGLTPVPVTTPTVAPALSDEELAALPQRSNKLLLGAALLLGVSLLGVGAFWAAYSGDAATTPEASAPRPPATATPPPEAEAGEAGEGTEVAPVPAGPAAAVTVQITTEPVNAEVYLDGMRIPNPFDGELPQTTEARRLEVRAEGYTTIAQDLVLQFPQRVRLTLERGTGIDDRSTASSRRGSGRSSGTPSSASAGTRPASTMAGADLPPPPSTPTATEMATPTPTPTPTPTATPPAAADSNMGLKQIRF